MRIFILSAIAVLWAFNAEAITLRIVGPNNALLFQSDLEISVPVDVGQATVLAFDRGHVPYHGGAYGIDKIFDLGQDINVLSDTEMKAYGWCFSLDGHVSETMPDQTPVVTSASVIEWYYAYAHYKNGDWVGQCIRN